MISKSVSHLRKAHRSGETEDSLPPGKAFDVAVNFRTHLWISLRRSKNGLVLPDRQPITFHGLNLLAPDSSHRSLALLSCLGGLERDLRLLTDLLHLNCRLGICAQLAIAEVRSSGG